MKKLEKLSLDQLHEEMTVLGSDEQREFIGGSGVIGSIVEYSIFEFEDKVENGTWTGGFVTGIGYVGYVSQTAFCYNGTSGDFYDFVSEGVSSGWNQIAGTVIDHLPILSEMTSYTQTQISNMRLDAINMLSSCGYAGEGGIVWNWSCTGGNGSLVIHLNISDPVNGGNIVSLSTNAVGYYSPIGEVGISKLIRDCMNFIL